MPNGKKAIHSFIHDTHDIIPNCKQAWTVHLHSHLGGLSSQYVKQTHPAKRCPTCLCTKVSWRGVQEFLLLILNTTRLGESVEDRSGCHGCTIYWSNHLVYATPSWNPIIGTLEGVLDPKIVISCSSHWMEQETRTHPPAIRIQNMVSKQVLAKVRELQTSGHIKAKSGQRGAVKRQYPGETRITYLQYHQLFTDTSIVWTCGSSVVDTWFADSAEWILSALIGKIFPLTENTKKRHTSNMVRTLKGAGQRWHRSGHRMGGKTTRSASLSHAHTELKEKSFPWKSYPKDFQSPFLPTDPHHEDNNLCEAYKQGTLQSQMRSRSQEASRHSQERQLSHQFAYFIGGEN